jgi:cell wall integrity and stress response component
MTRWSRTFSAGLAALLLLCLVAPARADNLAYCSSQNSAGDFAASEYRANFGIPRLTMAVSHDYQSHGWCTNHCNEAGKYAFAVILEKDCWCSNYVPEDTGDCNRDCPGFPDEKCGSTDNNLYSYVKLTNSPSGTIGGSQPTSTTMRPSEPATSKEATSSSEVLTVSTSFY